MELCCRWPNPPGWLTWNPAGAANRWRAGRQMDQRLVALQSQRGLYADLGRQLEEYAAKNPGQPVEGERAGPGRPGLHRRGRYRKPDARDAEGAGAQRPFGRPAGPLPDAAGCAAAGRVAGGGARQRLVPTCATARCKSPSAAIGRNWRTRALASRGSVLPPVWTRAYTALAGQYFDDHSPAIDAAFQAALDTRTIGERLKAPLKPDSIIVGSVWFYYGARYGEYLAAAKSNAGADDGCRHRWRRRRAIRKLTWRWAIGTPRRARAPRQSRNLSARSNSTRTAAMPTITSPACCGPKGGRPEAIAQWKIRAGYVSADSEPRRAGSRAVLAPRGGDVHRYRGAPRNRRTARRHRASARRLLPAQQRVPAGRADRAGCPRFDRVRRGSRDGWWNWAAPWTTPR